MTASLQTQPPSPTTVLVIMQTTALLTLYPTNLTALEKTLALLPDQRALVVLRAWRAVQTTQQLVRVATTCPTDADLEGLAHWVRWAKSVVEEACAHVNGQWDPRAAHVVQAVHPTLVAEVEMDKWLAGVAGEEVDATQATRRAWQLGLDMATAEAMDVCACCEVRALGLGHGSGWVHTRARAMGMAVDINGFAQTGAVGLGIDGVDGGASYYCGVWGCGDVDDASEVSGSTTMGQAGVGYLSSMSKVEAAVRREAQLEALWKEVWEASALSVDDGVCRRAEQAMAGGVDEPLAGDFAGHALECDGCFNGLIGG